jgi:Tol biopolymer transport system component/dienelactone hydrolase
VAEQDLGRFTYPVGKNKEDRMYTAPSVDSAAVWKRRFRASAILWTEIAKAAPTHGLVASNKSGVVQLYVWHVPTGELTQLTDRPEGKLFGLLSPDGSYVYYLDDQLGNEIGHYVRVPFEGGEPQDITPDMPPYSSFGLTVSLASNLIGFTLANPDGFHLYCIDLGPESTVGAPQLIYQSKKFAFGPFLSHNGEVAVMASTERTGLQHYSLIAVDPANGEQIGELWDGPGNSLEAVAFSPIIGDLRLLGTTDRTGVKRPLIWNPRTGDRTDLAFEELEGEIIPLEWSFDGKRILLCQFSRAVQQLYTYDLMSDTLTLLDHPSGTFGFFGDARTYWGPEGEIFAQWQDSTHPPQLIALDGDTGVETRTVLAAGEVPLCRPWKSITFTSSDGQEIQGWLGLPDGEGPFPTVLHTHGGPAAAMMDVFNPGSQAWLDHGFAYLTINFRGSTTFGKEFQEQIWGNLGLWEVEDMVAGCNWLVEQGIARQDQILLTGWSYGGYLTLQALGKRPDLWAGGMAGIAIADWAIMYEEAADTLRGWQVTLFGGTPEEKPEQYAASSPITYVQNVAAPVLIIQGRNDTRTPARPIEMYEAKMQSLGKPIEVHWFEAGHLGAFSRVEQSIEHQELMLRFAYRISGFEGV